MKYNRNIMENSNKILDARQRQLVKISAFTSKSDVKNLRIVLNEALDAGLTINEINEALAHLYAYVGFPPSIRGIHLFREVVEERKANGITDEKGRDATPVSDKYSRFERGEKAQMIVTAMTAEQLTALFAFNPLIDVFLKEHLFADIFDRDILSYVDRELVTVSSLASLNDPFVRSHIGGALNVGVTESQLQGVFDIIEDKIGKKEADNSRTVLAEVVASRA
ncbi:carboxymuconolactone decarboxylase family protein [Sphingobacterium anhuiense]|uniref:carboxymuconolactone decarboxylase family protein n=1 Tax=Sphingobacterium anhuiense TaxID=493780 RepID=UPI003C2D9C4D